MVSETFGPCSMRRAPDLSAPRVTVRLITKVSPMSTTTSVPRKEQKLLERFMLLSIATALATIGLKVSAAVMTGSVGFLSDALESGVNLVAAVVAFVALRIAAKPADANHPFGHGKSEYVSALVEGVMIFVAAAMIIYTSVQRLFNPQPLEQVGIGLALTTLASVLNLVVGLLLLRAGRKHRSAALSADGHHLITDVWTTIGVLVGIGAVVLTGWLWLDPLIALAVGANIMWTGYRLLKDSLSNLISAALPPEDLQKLDAFLGEFEREHGVVFGLTRTVESGRDRFVHLIMGVPGQWSVDRSHDLAEQLETSVEELLTGAETIVHVEPQEKVLADNRVPEAAES